MENMSLSFLPPYECPYLQKLSATDIYGKPILKGGTGIVPIDETEDDHNDEDFGD